MPSEIPLNIIRLSAPFVPPFDIVMGSSSSPLSPDDYIWFDEWKKVFAMRGLLDVNQPVYIDISSDEEDQVVEEEPNGNVAHNLVADDLVENSYETVKDTTENYMVSKDHMEDFDESTGTKPNSQGNILRETEECALSPLRQMRTMEMARKKHKDVPLRKGPILKRTARKSVPCPAALKKIKFSIN